MVQPLASIIWVWYCTPVLLTLGIIQQPDLECEASLGYLDLPFQEKKEEQKEQGGRKEGGSCSGSWAVAACMKFIKLFKLL